MSPRGRSSVSSVPPQSDRSPIDVVTPAPGVYAAIATIDDSSHQAAVHIGGNPTFDRDEIKFETHLLDFTGDLYGRTLAVDFVDRVRDISRFDSAEQLRDQLQIDVRAVRQILDSTHRRDV